MENPETVRKLEEMDLSPDGGQIIITRRFNGNRSVSRINGETVTLGRLKEAAQVLIDIHGQHEHQSLLYKKNHLAILDAFAKEAGEWKKKVADSYREYRRLEKELKEADKDEAERAKEISFLEFEIDEIENAGIDRKKALDLLVSENKIVLMATHDPILALIADKRIVINNGAIVAIHKTSENEKELLLELEKMDNVIQDLRKELRYGNSLSNFKINSK